MSVTFQVTPVNPPLNVLPGDIVALESGNWLRQRRGGTLVAERHLTTAGSVLVPGTAPGVMTVGYVFTYTERHMAVKTCTNVAVNTTTGVVRFDFSDGNQREFASHADAQATADQLDANDTLAENVLIAKAYRHSPDGTDLAAIVGSSCTIDSSADNPVQYNPSNALGG